MAAKKIGLGRGLDALFSENNTLSENSVKVRLSQIEPNRDQPRKHFDEQALSDLADSIKRHGLIQPLLVRQLSDNRYQIVAGERRWRACRLAGIDSIPVVVRDMDDSQVMEIALIENLQREDLSPIEEAEGYKALCDKFSMTQDQVAETVGKSRSAVTNCLRLLSLYDNEKAFLIEGKLSVGHARALLSVADPDLRREALRLILAGASVREIEAMGRRSHGVTVKKKERHRNRLFDEVELSLKTATGRKSRITGNGQGGVLHIEFYSENELLELAGKLAGDL